MVKSRKMQYGISLSNSGLMLSSIRTTMCLSSDLIKFKAVFLQEKQSLANVCCQTHESRKVVKGQSTIINFKNHTVLASRNWILTNRTMPTSVCFIP